MTEIASDPYENDPRQGSDNGFLPAPKEFGPTVTAVSTAITAALMADPFRLWTPKEMAWEIHSTPNAVTKALQRALTSKSGKKSIPAVKVAYGLYQYESPDEVPLNQMIERYGKLGVENLVFYKRAGSGRQCNTTPHNATSDLEIPTNEEDRSKAAFKPDYPRRFKTKQEIHWLIWPNGTEKVHFISNGRPFPLEWIIDLLEQMEEEGLTGDLWVRDSIEYNIDSLNATITPDSITLQRSAGSFLKVYNHGEQMRLEEGDRRQVSMLKAHEDLLARYNAGAGEEALKRIKTIEDCLDTIKGETIRARKTAQKAFEKIHNHVLEERRNRDESQNN